MDQYWLKSGDETHKKKVEELRKAEFEAKMENYWQKKDEPEEEKKEEAKPKDEKK